MAGGGGVGVKENLARLAQSWAARVKPEASTASWGAQACR